MRSRIYFILTAIIYLISNNAAYSQTPITFEQTERIKVAGIKSDTSIQNLSAYEKDVSRVFLDGLGRPIQSVVLKGSPTQKDIIQPVDYDAQGRQNRSYLPYAGNDGTGVYRPNALSTEQPAFYSNGTADKIADDSKPYAEQLFENSPLQRVLSAGSVGNGFQPLAGDHYATMNYRTSVAADGTIPVWLPGGTKSGVYAAGSLNVTQATDTENHTTLIFTDNVGRTLLKRQVVSATENNDTYYVYNEAGLISHILPPKAVNLLAANSSYTLSTAIISKLIFTYTYDDKGRLTEKTIPGAGAVSMVYDPLDRLVLAQNAKLKASNQWNYIKYDVRGNAIAQGVYTDNTRTTLAAMQTYVSGLNYSTNWYEKRGTSSTTGYYTNVTFPTSSKTDLAFSYYDDYDINSDGVANYNYLTQGLTGEATATTQIRGMLTMVRKYTVGAAGGTWIMSIIFYDKRGNVIQERSSNQITTSTNDTKTIVPDFTGTPKQTKVVKSVNSVSTTVLSTYTYDHMQRVTAIDQSYNGGATVRVAGYEYNELGQLIDKKLGSTNGGSTYLQSIDYRYNIKGQFTSINNSKLSNDGVKNNDSNDLFGIELLYNQADANVGNTAYFDGNLSAVKWMSKNAANTSSYERSYKYSYDALKRLTAANYAERTTAGTGAFNYNVNGFSENNITYDENGNIQTLKRNSSAPGAASIVEVDNLTYTYDTANPNQLKNVTDGSTTNHTGYGFRNLTGTTTGNYAYDAAGNLTTDPYKGLTIAYNYLNRTDKITITTGTGRYINYTYSADGVLLKKQQYDNSTLQKTTDYIDGFVYENGTLAYFAIPEGRVRNVSGTLKSEYVITDHQGNARISFEDNGSGTAVVKQENSYYAFGLTMASSSSPVPTPTQPNKNLYNGGSEWQNDFDNLPDYYQTFYRNYDAALCRFIAVDPMAEATESMTVYQYSGNNPIMFNDPLGDLFKTWDDVQRAVDNIQSNGRYGGHAKGADDFWTYGSESDAFLAGANYINNFGGWGQNGSPGSYAQAAEGFNGFNPGQKVDTKTLSKYVQTVYWYHDANGEGITRNGVSANAVMELVGESDNEGHSGVGQPGFGESLIPVWGSGRAAIDHFQNGNYWRGAAYTALAISDVFLVKAAATALAKGTITLAAKYAVRQAVKNPVLTIREAAAMANPRVAAMMEGKGIDRAFREIAGRNLILNPAEKMGLIKINPMNRGADVIGTGFLNGTWWDVTTRAAWGAHEAKYGAGGIGLFY